MSDYNFLNLSPYEFEILTRDLLQEHLNTNVESFTNGPDGGIDLRCSVFGNTIIQCKRYTDYSNLKTGLSKEVTSVKKNNPDKYLIVTSVGLTPKRKLEIFNLFSPYIKSTEDIYGKEDLNNLLTLNPKVERNHFKLWLSSVNILQLIVDRNIINQSQFAIEDIKEKIKIYVQNDSFPEASEILKKDNYVVISGIPGIGKTTLAEILTYDLLAKGVEDFIYLSDTIEQGYKMFNEEKSQVFLFDDFLGRNFLENSISTNEESQILKFIKKIQNSRNKFLIFTTREYILKQAKQKFDLLDDYDLSKCIIDLSKYTKLVRAKILYNHLFFNGIPAEYIQEIRKQDFLFKIIDHKNYNPRIIETITNNKEWKKYHPIKFPKRLFEVFEKPNSVWEHAFENAITEFSRIVMLNYLVIQDVTYKELYKIVYEFCFKNQIQISVNSVLFKKSIRELEGSFISIGKSHSGESKIYYQNPSIQDFLVNYVNKDEDIKTQLVNGANYLNPLLRIFSNNTKTNLKYKLNQTGKIKSFLDQKIMADFYSINFDTPNFYNNQSGDDLIIHKLDAIILNVVLDEHLERFIFNEFEKVLYSEQIISSIPKYINLLTLFKEKIDIDVNKLLSHFVGVIEEYEELISIDDLRLINNDEFESFYEQNEETFDDMVYGVASGLDGINLDYPEIVEMLEDIQERFFVDVSEEIRELRDKIAATEYEGELHYEDWKERGHGITIRENIDTEIDNLFNSFE